MGKLAQGRTLAEFFPLKDAELKILAAVASGTTAIIGETRPDAWSETCEVRADFLRFLALGGDDDAPVHEHGLSVHGAWITGKLDLSYAEIAGALKLAKCRFEGAPALYDTHIKGLFSLAGSAVRGLNADRLICRSSVFLRGGFTSSGEIRLLGATIGGNLGCDGGKFENSKGTALIADQIKVMGSVSMGDGFRAKGEVRLRGAKIGGNLECTGGKFEKPDGKPDGKVLIADQITVGGSVVMNDGFQAKGTVRLSGAKIGGNLDCIGGTFTNTEGKALIADGITVGGSVFMSAEFQASGIVHLLGAKISGELTCRGGQFGSKNSFAINGQGMSVAGGFLFDRVTITGGAVDVNSAHVARLVDDLQSWPENSVLDGFVYDGFAGDAPTSAKDRLAWLDRQHPEHSGAAKNPREFRPQPWQQLRKVLRERGHLEDARAVAIAFEDRKRACGVIGESSAPITCWKLLGRRTARGFHFLYGKLIDYGYRPVRLFWILVAVWFCATVFFTVGACFGAFGPTDLTIVQNSTYGACDPEKNPTASWTSCKTLPGAYPAFYPPLYALDVLLPVAKLGQQEHWAPLDPSGARTPSNKALIWGTQIAVWFEILFGWIAGLLLAATVTGLTKRNED